MAELGRISAAKRNADPAWREKLAKWGRKGGKAKKGSTSPGSGNFGKRTPPTAA